MNVVSNIKIEYGDILRRTFLFLPTTPGHISSPFNTKNLKEHEGVYIQFYSKNYLGSYNSFRKTVMAFSSY